MKTKPLAKIAICVIAIYMQTKPLLADEPQEFTILRDSYHRAVKRALDPIEEKYISELTNLKLRYTKAGKLQEAIFVDKEINILIDKNTQPKAKEQTQLNPKHLFGEWYCNGVENDIYYFNPNKKAFHAAHPGTWEADEKTITITWENGYRLVIELNQTEETIYGKSYRPGADYPSEYTQLKFSRKK